METQCDIELASQLLLPTADIDFVQDLQHFISSTVKGRV